MTPGQGPDGTLGTADDQRHWEPIVAGFSNNTAPHADTRNFLFDRIDNSLIVLDDGGIYRMRSPATITVNANPVADDTLTVGGITYTFQGALTAANQILIGANTAATAQHVRHAVNDISANEGMTYGNGTVPNPQVLADPVSGTTVPLRSKSSPALNVAPTQTGAGLLLTASNARSLNADVARYFSAGSVTVTSAPANADRLIVGGITYRFRMALTGAANEIIVGANTAATASNIADAIRDNQPNEGMTYGAGTTRHPDVFVGAVAGSTVRLVSLDTNVNARNIVLNERSRALTRTRFAAIAGASRAALLAGTRHWISLNGDLPVAEFTDAAWDPVSGILLGGTQDNRQLEQIRREPNARDDDMDAVPDNPEEARFWREPPTTFYSGGFAGGDGGDVAVERESANRSHRYRVVNDFDGFIRQQFRPDNTRDPDNTARSETRVELRRAGSSTRLSGLVAADHDLLYPQFVINSQTNSNNDRRLLLGGNHLYETGRRLNSIPNNSSENRGRNVVDLVARDPSLTVPANPQTINVPGRVDLVGEAVLPADRLRDENSRVGVVLDGHTVMSSTMPILTRSRAA